MATSQEKMEIQSFKALTWEYYKLHGRHFPWRSTDDPYNIVVSEVMLQQTQTYRVEPKYEQFIQKFTNFEALANASLQDVLTAWQGLGYNRRAQLLQRLAIRITQEFGGVLPPDPAQLETFPGIGKATASSICAFAFNMPTVFIETNIRTVFIAHFFKQQDKVNDRDILPLVQQSLDNTNPREWYYALMDYGVYLKKLSHNKIALKSAHYVRQSPFQGSDRQIRSQILRAVLAATSLPLETVIAQHSEPERVTQIINQLIKDGLIEKNGEAISIGKK